MKRALAVVGVPAILMLIVAIVFTASFRVHVGGVGRSSAGGDLQGVFVYRDEKVCLAGPFAIVSIWLSARKLKDEPGRAFSPDLDNATFDVHWLGTDRDGWMDARDPAIRATWTAIERAGWPCSTY